jgi:hypothetical protein
MTMRRRWGIAAGMACALCMVAASPASAALNLSSTFDSNAEGWETFVDSNPPASANYDNGLDAITLTDADNTPEAIAAFLAPPSWSGDATDNYGGTFQFDLKSTTTWTSPVLAQIGKAGTVGDPDDFLCFQTAGPVNTNYQTFQFTLDTTDARDCQSGDPASEGHVVFVMQDVGSVVISGDDAATSGETTHLDNVSLSGGGPPPPFDVPRELSIDYQKLDSPFLNPFWAFTGNLTGDDDTCIEGRKVIFFRKQKGPDEKLGARTTGDGGSYRFAYDKRRGTYYALSREVDLGVPNCLEAKSDTVKVG